MNEHRFRRVLCVKFQAPHAIDAMLSPQLRLPDGVEFPGHRRDVVPVTASARWREVHEGPRNISTRDVTSSQRIMWAGCISLPLDAYFSLALPCAGPPRASVL